MNKLLVFIIIISSFANAQNQRISYLYQVVPDSTNRVEVKSEMMILEILPKFSKFYSETVYKSDSAMKVMLEKELKSNGAINIKSDMRKGFFREVIIKEEPDFKTFLMTRNGQTQLKVYDDRIPVWKILPEKQKMGDFQTQKAETEMYGRKWTAWFTTSIPIQEGPYKFHGLPGLIVKIEDQDHSHSFSLVGIKNLTSEDVKNIDPKSNFVFEEGKYINMDQVAYKKFYLESRNDPNKAVRSSLGQMQMTQINIDGKMMDVNEFLRNQEKQQKEKNSRDNNILELDLLK